MATNEITAQRFLDADADLSRGCVVGANSAQGEFLPSGTDCALNKGKGDEAPHDTCRDGRLV
jgi:hypothetical protein